MTSILMRVNLFGTCYNIHRIRPYKCLHSLELSIQCHCSIDMKMILPLKLLRFNTLILPSYSESHWEFPMSWILWIFPLEFHRWIRSKSLRYLVSKYHWILSFKTWTGATLLPPRHGTGVSNDVGFGFEWYEQLYLTVEIILSTLAGSNQSWTNLWSRPHICKMEFSTWSVTDIAITAFEGFFLIEIRQVICRFPIISLDQGSKRLSPCEEHDQTIFGNDVAIEPTLKFMNLSGWFEKTFWKTMVIHMLFGDTRWMMTGQIRLSSSEIFWISLVSCCYKSTLCLWTVKHPFAILENSALRRDWNLTLCLPQQASPDNPTCRLEAFNTLRASRRNRTVHKCRTCKNRNGQVRRRRPGFRHSPVFILSVLASFSPSFRCS